MQAVLKMQAIVSAIQVSRMILVIKDVLLLFRLGCRVRAKLCSGSLSMAADEAKVV
jgi:hypothetical protein